MFFDLSFISMLIEEIVEDDGLFWTERGISPLYINRGSYQDKIVKVVDGNLYLCWCIVRVRVLSVWFIF